MSTAPEIVTASAIAPSSLPVPTAPAATEPAESTPPPEQAAAPQAGETAAPLDDAGRPFDPSKHLPKKHPSTGRWMPKGGRTKKPSTASSAPAPSFIPAAVPPAPKDPGESTGKDPKPDPAAAEGVDCSEEAGDLGAHALQFLAGMVFDAFEEASCEPAEHARMSKGFAVYIRSKGWKAAAGVAVSLIVAGYFLRLFRRDKIRAKAREWMHGKAAEHARNVTPPDQRPAAAETKPAPAPVGSAQDVIELYRTTQP